jgi:drug/metabolite transporter (DMT)-like permease
MFFKRIANTPYVLLILSTLFWGGNAVAGKYLAGSIPPVTISFIRLALSVSIVFPFLYPVLKKEFQVARVHLLQLTILALTGIVGYNLLGYWALNYTSAINFSLLNSTTPLFMFLLTYMMTKEKMNMKYVLSVLISISGVVFVITQGSIEKLISLKFNFGDLIMILAVILWSIYSLIVQKVSNHMSSFSVFGYSLGIGFLFMIPAVLIELSFVSIQKIDYSEVVALFYLGIFPSVCSFLFWNRAVVLIGPSKSSIFLNLIPIFGATAAYYVLGEAITIYHVVGGILVFAGIYLSSYTKKTSILQTKEAVIRKSAN